MRFNSRQIQFPAQVLAIDLPHICHKEGIIISRLADVVINSIYPFLERVSNQLLWANAIMSMATVVIRIIVLMITSDWYGCIFFSTSDGRKCHNHAGGGI